MYFQKFQSAAGSKIAVTSTSTKIFDLINTSQSTSLENAGFSARVNAIIIQPEDGDIRFLFNDQDPTSTNGFKVTSGSIATLCNIPLKSLRLIRTGGSNVACSIQVGVSDMSESSSITGSGGGSSAITSIVPGTGATNLGKAEDAAHTSGDVGAMSLGVRKDTAVALAGTDGDYQPMIFDSTGRLHTREGFAPNYEDQTNNKAVVEHRYSYTKIAADSQIKASAGFIHTVTFSATGTVTAGVITIYDNTAESGTVLWTGTIQVGTPPISILFDVTTATGIYIGYDGTIANVATTISWR